MKKWYHLAFVVVCAAVLAVLLNAPDVKTPRLPADETHRDRKDYPRCPSCHGTEAQSPMPDTHFGVDRALRPDHQKCYFCHKPPA